MLIISTFNHNNLKYISSFQKYTILKRSIATLRDSAKNCSQITGTHLMKPLGITIIKRFGGTGKTPKGPPPTSVGKGTSIKPSSLAKPKTPSEPKPISPKYHNPNNVGSFKPLAPYNYSRDSYLTKPGVVHALQEQKKIQENHANTTTSTTVLDKQPLNSDTGAVVVYNPKSQDPIIIKPPIFIDPIGKAHFTLKGIVLPPTLEKEPITEKQTTPLDNNNSTINTTTSFSNPNITTSSNPPLTPTTSSQVAQDSNTTSQDVTTEQSSFSSTHTTSSNNNNNSSSSSSMPISKETTPTNNTDTISKQQQFKPTTPANTQIVSFPKETNKNIIDKTIEDLCNKLSNTDLKTELLDRGLIKEATDKIITLITTEEKTIVLGKSPNNIKITPSNVAYKKLIPNKTEGPLLKNFENSQEYFLAIVSISDHTFLADAIQKHIVIVVKVDKDKYIITSYLTSKKAEEELAKYKFKVYQDAQENAKELPPLNKQSQHISSCNNPVVINANQLTFLKWDTQYFADMKVLAHLKDLFNSLKEKATVSYEAEGIQKKTLIQMCIDFDYRIKNQLSHPKTKDQLDNEAKIIQANKDNAHAFIEQKIKMKAMYKNLYLKKTVKSIPKHNDNDTENTNE